jgi:endonuclease/exonuclease/phosphatase (EEP) superfamily protein YafD
VERCGWLYLNAVLVVWLLLKIPDPRFWPATLFLYGPRWGAAAPLLVLLPGAIAFRRGILPLSVSLIVLTGPLLGFCIPYAAATATATLPGAKAANPGQGLRVLTCNTEGEALDPVALGSLIVEVHPDVVVLQEWAARGTATVFWQAGWHVRAQGGLCLASRYPIRRAVISDSHELGGRGVLACYDLEVANRSITLFNVHLATLREGAEAFIGNPWYGLPILQECLAVQWHQSEVARRWVDRIGRPVILAGDFNLPAESAIYQFFWSGFTDAFSSSGLGFGPTKFTRWYGARIDHVLAGDGWQARRCWVGPDVGSDHRPVIADLVWVGRADGG